MKDTTALARAAQGNPPAKAAGTANPTVTKYKNQIEEMAGKLANKGKQMKAVAENAESAMLEGLRTVETQGTLLLATMAEGYWGRKRMRVMGVPFRAVAGVGLKGWSMVDKLRKGADAGEHQAAFGEGLLAADIASLGLELGQTLAEKRQTPPPPGAAAPAAIPDAPPPAVNGPLREMADQGLDLSGPELGRVGDRRRERRAERAERAESRMVQVRVI